MNQVEICNITKYNINQEKLEKLLDFVIEKENLKKICFNVVLIDDKEMKKLNKQYRNIDKTTDVLSFALEDHTLPIQTEYRILGDIYISIEKAKFQTIDNLDNELCFLMIHGFYHLLGFDHQNENDEKIMFQKQEEVLREYGIKR